jgi:inward rectifier potassium channel
MAASSARPQAAGTPPNPYPRPTPIPGAYRERLDVRRLGFRTHFWEDMYHAMLVTPWWRILVMFLLVFIGINLAFALTFRLTGGVQGAQTYWELFFFSVQTFSTIGYGAMSPVGIPAEVVTTFEAFVGVLVNAFAAGIVVIKFARPTARVMFSNVMTVAPFDGTPTLMVRMANSRANQVFDAQLRMFLLRDVKTREGFTMRRLYDLRLTRESSPFFTLTLTGMHPIDADSPLNGLTRADLEAVRAQIIVTIQGVDESFMTQVHARRFYTMAEIAWDAHFSDVLSLAPDGKLVVDYARFHDVVRRTEPAIQG